MKRISQISKGLIYLSSIILAGMMLLTVADVFFRFFFDHPILGVTEITESMMTGLAFFAMAWCAVQKDHLKVDLVVNRFRPKIQAIIDTVTLVLGVIIVGLFAWRGALEGAVVKDLHLVSSLAGIPTYPFYYVIALGSAMLCVVMISQIFENIKTIIKP